MLDFVITGCGRSGTQWIAQVLNHLPNFTCTHEKVFGWLPERAEDAVVRVVEATEKQGANVEVSWKAAPFLGCFPDLHVLHQMRDPLKVVTCWVSHDLLTVEASVKGYVGRFFPECVLGSNPLLKAIRYVLQWSELCQRRSITTYRVEDVTPKVLRDFVTTFSHEPSLKDVEEAMGLVPKNAGSCAGMHKEITWGDVMQYPEGRRLRQMADWFNY